MKKLMFLGVLMVLVLMVCSLGVIACNEGEFNSSEYWEEYNYGDEYDRFDDDGLAWESEVDEDNVILEELNREGVNYDRNTPKIDDDQKLEVIAEAKAYIPCYLELELMGNYGLIDGQSFGPDTADLDASSKNFGATILFDNEMGGFVDENWNSKGAGRNAEIAPGEDTFIASCDIYRVKAYGNDDYKYEVESAPLVAADNIGTPLPLYMRTSFDAGDSWDADQIFDSARNLNIAEKEATSELEIYHNFKVPYGRNVVHGEYTGEVIFRVVTM